VQSLSFQKTSFLLASGKKAPAPYVFILVTMTRSASKSGYNIASAKRFSRRALILVGSLIVAFSSQLDAASPPRLYVFANADMKAQAFEKQLESQLSGVDVTVFSRIRGFEPALKDSPDGVLARTSVLESLGLHVDLQGQHGNKSTERYVLISTNSPVSPQQLQGKTLGAVNILGRKHMDIFISKILGGIKPKLTHVTHERDLLALLQFGAADAVITSQKWADKFNEKSEMNLKITPLSNEVGLPAVSFGSGGGRSALESKIKSAGASFNAELGVTQWR
jgi:hypothetical protein